MLSSTKPILIDNILQSNRKCILKDLNTLIIARALHIIGVILWIGGVAFVTTVLIPSLKRNSEIKNRMELFVKLEEAFSLQAKVTTLVTGLTGIYMLYFLDAWNRYLQLQYWWIHLMTLVWLFFSIVLFILEPLYLHKWFDEKAKQDIDYSLMWLQRMHIILLSISIFAILTAMAGANGYVF